MAPPRLYKNFINGEWVESVTGQAFENLNPANRDDLVGMFPKSNCEDVDTAVAAAKEAYKSWRMMPAPKRGEILFREREVARVDNRREVWPATELICGVDWIV